jgi:acetyl-CoA carboxylase carboxyl transferase subunit beta
VPPDVQSAEHLHDHGLSTLSCRPGAATVAARILRVLDGADAAPTACAACRRRRRPLGTDLAAADGAWDSVRRTRRPERPGVADWLASGFTDVTVLSGTGEGEYEPSLLLALARLGERSVVVLGQDRRRAAATAPLGPAGLRTARRGMRLAEELGLALVTVIDTSGAALTAAAEEGGLAQEIARSLAEQVSLATPTLAVLLGQGAGSGLALLPADRVVPRPTRGSRRCRRRVPRQIVHRSADHAAGMAAAQASAPRTSRQPASSTSWWPNA